MSWTDERVSLLKQLWGEGKTAAEIAKELGEGVTRNAVIGKAHRLKLASRISPIQQNAKKAAIKKPKEKPKTVSAAAIRQKVIKNIIETESAGSSIKMEDLKDRMCRWPIGDPRDANFGFCGCKSEPSLSYCAEHAIVAYQAPNKAKKLVQEELENGNNTKTPSLEDIKVA